MPSLHEIRRHEQTISAVDAMLGSSAGSFQYSSVDSITGDNHFRLMPDRLTSNYPNLTHTSHLEGIDPYTSVVPHIPVIFGDDIVSGTQISGRMSSVRRQFCVLLVFDLLFTSLLWFITTSITGKDVKAAIHKQVLEYTIYSSMFDIVVVSLMRFFICTLCFALFRIKHWWPVALTTTITCAFLIAKIFEYQWGRVGQLTCDVIMVLLSFILSWGEVWFLDFKVFPLESKANILQTYQQQRNSERTPLIAAAAASSNNGLTVLQRYMEGSLWEGSVANFYSPLESPADSEEEADNDRESRVQIPRRFHRSTPLSQVELNYLKEAEDALQRAWNNMNLSQWKCEKRLGNEGGAVYSKVVNSKKLFKVKTVVGLPSKVLFHEIYYNVESSAAWNSTIAECKIIQIINQNTDITYHVTNESARGLVSTRDFVTLRRWELIPAISKEAKCPIYVSAGISIEHIAVPPHPKHIRGHNGPCCIAICSNLADASGESCIFEWLLDTDIKGWIPTSVVDSALVHVQLDYISSLKRLASKLSASQSLSSTAIA